jgi:hypothetical protein
METLLWLGAVVVLTVALFLAAPYHQRIIDNRPRLTKDWD